MNKKPLPRFVWLILVVGLGLGLVGGTIAFAQYQARALTEKPEVGEADELEAMLAMDVPVSYISGVTEGLPPDENPVVTGVNTPEGTDATFKYYMVSGATMRGRESTATYAYANLGCVYSVDVDQYDRLLNTELFVEDYSTIKYLRLYFYDASTTARPISFLTTYQPGTLTTDLISINNTAMDLAAPGYGYVVSSEITHTVNNISQAYTLIGWSSAATSNIRICGIRIAYYEPVIYTIAMPLITRNQ